MTRYAPEASYLDHRGVSAPLCLWPDEKVRLAQSRIYRPDHPMPQSTIRPHGHTEHIGIRLNTIHQPFVEARTHLVYDDLHRPLQS